MQFPDSFVDGFATDTPYGPGAVLLEADTLLSWQLAAEPRVVSHQGARALAADWEDLADALATAARNLREAARTAEDDEAQHVGHRR